MVRFVNAPNLNIYQINRNHFIRERQTLVITVSNFYSILTVEAIQYIPFIPLWKPCGIHGEYYDIAFHARRHKEIFGHQRGGPILTMATPALTKRRDEGIA
jgi:hypothetical protein